MEPLKVGQLAARTGLSVRTLHHYDEIGLLRPSGRTPAGHRLYGRAEVERLQQVASLRQLGLPLGEIRDCLDRPGFSLEGVLEIQIERLREDIGSKERLCALLEGLLGRLAADEDVSLDELTGTIEGTVALERYYTPDQLERLARRREAVGEDRMLEAQEEWAALFASFTEAMEAGIDPADERVQALSRRSAALIEEFTGGDAGIRASLSEMYQAEGADAVMERQGMAMRPALWAYMMRAAECRKGTES